MNLRVAFWPGYDERDEDGMIAGDACERNALCILLVCLWIAGQKLSKYAACVCVFCYYTTTTTTTHRRKFVQVKCAAESEPMKHIIQERISRKKIVCMCVCVCTRKIWAFLLVLNIFGDKESDVHKCVCVCVQLDLYACVCVLVNCGVFVSVCFLMLI